MIGRMRVFWMIQRYWIVISLIFFIHPSFSQEKTYRDEECLSCHGKPNISQIMIDGKIRSIYVDPDKWSQDIHHKGNLGCVDCHSNANPYLHFREGFIDVDCAGCHPEEEEEYQKNIHLTFPVPSAGKKLPLCYHCHTKHHILPHNDPSSSIHEKNMGETCGECHAEVMVRVILKGTSLGKISGHRKGDLSERFDMKVCINCHYEDSAHGAKRAYKDFCSRCHDVRSKGSALMGPTHLDSARWAWLNYTGGGLVVLLLVGLGALAGYRTRTEILSRIKIWLDSMKIEKAIEEEKTGQRNKDEEQGP